jgi:hypothetical protein
MKPIWIVDDDHSIRFVLEKALARENLQVRSLMTRCLRFWCRTFACRVNRALNCSRV